MKTNETGTSTHQGKDRWTMPTKVIILLNILKGPTIYTNEKYVP